ncbi:M23 family metallopeptidase [Marisediminicola senii]|uniref:M23 family metallopeptidase n=1 Tax=Marisediminicola senii TaxID=2711233 RepID=UPI0013EC6479|nr:M23 family metallopeptidase [Marisediminicola senii]
MTVAVVAAVVLFSTAVAGPLTPAHAEPDNPTWADVEAARGNEEATRVEIERITSLLAALSIGVDEANAVAERRGTKFQLAQDELDRATGKTEALQEEAAEAEDDAAEVKQDAGQQAAMMARATNETTLEVFFAGDRGNDLLDRLSTASKLAERNESLFTRATIATQTAGALGDQASIAEDELTRLAAASQQALTDAAEAQRVAEVALQEQQTRDAQLQAQLATLCDTRITVEQGYALEEQKRATAAAAAAAAPSASSASSTAAPGVSGAISAQGWTNPIVSFGSYQGYGNRLHPVYKEWRLHAGDDYGSSCGTPLFATAAGTVIASGPAGGYGNQIVIDHGDGITSSYSHMYANGLLVRTGAKVAAGQQVAAVGNAGVSTGCHLHFEIRRGGVAISPAPFLQSKGVG